MDFWGVEVECGETQKVDPPKGKVVHISQVILGESENEERVGLVHLKLKNDCSTILLGPLSYENTPQLPCQLSFGKGFELSHDWKNGSVYLYGYIVKGIAGEPAYFVKPKFRNVGGRAFKVELNQKRPSESGAPLRTALCNPTHPSKRRRFDLPRCFYDESAFAFANFVSSLREGLRRVRTLLFVCSAFSETLMKLKADFLELLNLISMSTPRFSQKDRFFELTILVLERWKSVEDEIEQQQQYCVRQLPRTPSGYPEPVPSAWVVMSDWHDLAYEELLSIRNEHSFLLDDAYKEKYDECFKENKIHVSLLLLYKKRLNFLGSSKDDISSLPKVKCYTWLMHIKSFLIEEKYTTTRNQHENLHRPPTSRNSRDHRQCNWRDEIYKQLIISRKKHSRRLDEAYRYVYEWRSSTKTLGVWADEFKYSSLFLRNSLDFLGKCRADLVFETEERCRFLLKEIDLFIEHSPDSHYALMVASLQAARGFYVFETQPDTSVANWRDVAYKQLKSKESRFSFLLYNGLYQKNKDTWSEEPKLAKLLSELDECMTQASDYYKTTRYAMSLFSSEDEYFNFVDAKVDALYRSMDLIKELQGGNEPEWDPLEMIPKGYKMSRCQ